MPKILKTKKQSKNQNKALLCITSGFVSYKKLWGRGIIIGLISSMILFSVIFLIVLFSMKFEISSKVLVLLPVCVIPGIAGGILSANK